MKVLLIVALVWFSTTCFARQDTLLWSDEFDGTGLPNPANWNCESGNNGFGNNEIQNYTNNTRNIRQENGVLVIEARKSGSSWTSARVTTNNKYEFAYGRIVFRAKLPAGIGTWPALWLLGANTDSVGWPACGEIDIMEHVGKDPAVVQSAMHTPSSYGNTINKKSKFISTYNSEFHLYEANWKSDRIEFSYDNTLIYTYKPHPLNASTWPFSNPCYIIMNIAMGGNLGSDPKFETSGLKNGIDPALTSARMEIDYVRVYQPVTVRK
jgi:beta-glucanase (GH16 family)